LKLGAHAFSFSFSFASSIFFAMGHHDLWGVTSTHCPFFLAISPPPHSAHTGLLATGTCAVAVRTLAKATQHIANRFIDIWFYVNI
jgi:hypothetical protein